MQPPLDEFLSYELNDRIRSQLLHAIAETLASQEYFTYNTFNVLLDAETSTVTIEDELDVGRQSTLTIAEFVALLQPGDCP